MLTSDALGYWAPSRADIRRLEGRLRARVVNERPDVAAQLATYKRQYFGFTRGERRRILIVGFCEAPGIDSRHEFVSAAESKACRFEAEYDLFAGEISSFWVLEE